VLAFQTFADRWGKLFLSALEPVEVARRGIQLQEYTLHQGLSLDNVFGVLSSPSFPIDDLVNLLVAYERFASVSFSWGPEGYQWTSVSQEGPEVQALRLELASLKLQLEKTAEVPLTPLSPASLKAFQAVSGRSKWMLKMTTIFGEFVHSRSEDMDEGPSPYLERLWEAMVEAHLENQKRFRQGIPSTGGGSSGFPRSQAGISVDTALSQGGTLSSEDTPRGQLTFCLWRGAKYYVAQKTKVLWDVSLPPPGVCNKCREPHWFWECKVQG
jgi:hypothetical protein